MSGSLHIMFRAPASWPEDPVLLEFLESAMQLLGYWPFTIVTTKAYTDPETGAPMLEALLEVDAARGV